MTTAVLEGLLQEATVQLGKVTAQPRDEAEWLLAELLGVDRSQLRRIDQPLTAPQQQRFAEWLQRRAEGEPFAYVTGTQPFRRLIMHVSADVLIPRADTEHLVTWALQVLASGSKPPRVLDACTGSGCVALAIADEAPGHEVWASDCSPTALAVAQANAARLQLPVHCFHADGLSLPSPAMRFDLVTANPPYIAEGDAHLPALQHEPTLALGSGPDGLTLLRQLIVQAPHCLQPGGWLLLEQGYDQGAAVRALFEAQGFERIETRRDYGGNERVTGACWPAAHD